MEITRESVKWTFSELVRKKKVPRLSAKAKWMVTILDRNKWGKDIRGVSGGEGTVQVEGGREWETNKKKEK